MFQRIVGFCKKMLVSFRRMLAQFIKPSRQTSFSGVVWVEPRGNDLKALKARKLVIVGVTDKGKWLRFLCPCGCGEVQALNLMKSQYPVWKIEIHTDQTLTASPSVDAQKCGAHFWICHNRIEWCK